MKPSSYLQSRWQRRCRPSPLGLEFRRLCTCRSERLQAEAVSASLTTPSALTAWPSDFAAPIAYVELERYGFQHGSFSQKCF